MSRFAEARKQAQTLRALDHRPWPSPPMGDGTDVEEIALRSLARRAQCSPSGDRPGIWFFSLDASSRPAVEAARRTYRLPYRYAQIDARAEILYARRVGEDAQFSARYRGTGNPAPAKPGTLEHFLTERYCLYGGDGGRVRAEIHHPPWPLQPAEATVEQFNISPVPLEGEPLYHYAGAARRPGPVA